MDRLLIGIDVGTTGTKSMLVSEAGEIVSHAYAGYALKTPGPGRCEQDPEDWWRALVKTVRSVTAEAGRAERVAALSLSLQGGTFVPVDENLRPTYPAIVWSDARAEAQGRAFAERFGAEYMYQRSGWRLGKGLNALQTVWLRENDPDAFRRTARFLSVPDYLSARLTGRAAVDISNAGINQYCDIRSAAYDPAILDFAGVGEEKLSPILPSGTPIGTLTPAAAAELGLPAGTLLVAGAHDQYATLVGAGITRAGQVLIGTGTAWVVTALTEEADFSSGFSQSVPAAGRWGSLVAISNGGVCLDWLRNRISPEGEGGLPYAQIDAAAAERAPGAGGLMFYPYFNGGAFPLDAPQCRGTFLGLDLSHDRLDLARAVMEGVAMQAVWTLEFFRAKGPIPSLTLSGGAAKSAPWTRMVADLAGCPVLTPGVSDLACVGAAVMAGAGSGVFPSMESGAARMRLGGGECAPDPERSALYREHFETFKRRAEALGDVYRH